MTSAIGGAVTDQKLTCGDSGTFIETVRK